MGSKLYVGNLAFSTTESELRDLFTPYGNVAEVFIAMDKFSGRSRGFAFVTMGSDAEAKAAIAAVNGKNVGTGRIDHTQCCAFSADEGADVGADEGTPVTEAYKVPFKFTGKIAKVTIELEAEKRTDRNDAEQARRQAALKKALAD